MVNNVIVIFDLIRVKKQYIVISNKQNTPTGKFVQFFLVIREKYDWPAFFFFLKFLADTCPFLGATGTNVLDFWCRLLWVLKPEWVLSYSLLCRGECNVHSLRCTSGATCADLLAIGMQLVTSPHACTEVGLGSVLNGQSPRQKMNALPLCQRPGSRNSLVVTLPFLSQWGSRCNLSLGTI